MKTFHHLIQEERSHYWAMHKAAHESDTLMPASTQQPDRHRTSSESLDALRSLLFDYSHSTAPSES